MDATQWKLEANNSNNNVQEQEMKVRPQEQQGEALNCPRCKSSNTKFCYYNNYSLTQPRYLCKACRRYWTQGGSLRNVPVGGSSRKNKRSIPKPQDFTTQTTQNLNFSFQQNYHHDFSHFLKPPKPENTSTTTNHLNPFNSNSNQAFNVQEFKPFHENGGFQEMMLPFGVMNQEREEGGGQNMGGTSGYWTSTFMGGD